MKPIYLLCLWNVRTGGPEAIHQLSDALIEQGFDARMVYYDMGQIQAPERSNSVVRIPHADRPKMGGLSFGLRSNTVEDYAHYKVNPVDAAPDDPDAIIVLPEAVAHLAAFFPKATVLIWWLSVDNAFGALAFAEGTAGGHQLYGGINLNWLRKRNVWHAVQSPYAGSVTNALQFRSAGMLGDYTVDLSAYATPLPMEERPPLVVLQTNKTAIDFAELEKAMQQVQAELAPDLPIEVVAASGKSRRELAQLFAKARLYVDLGSFPGRDRMPREAASMGCGVLANYVGGALAGAPPEPPPPWWPAHPSQSLESIAEDIIGLTKTPRPLTWDIVVERATFFAQVQDVFGDLCAP